MDIKTVVKDSPNKNKVQGQMVSLVNPQIVTVLIPVFLKVLQAIERE